jgi:hypothetical protein
MQAMSNLIKLKNMKTKQFAGWTCALVMTIMGTTISAQEAEKHSSQTAQFTFAYPLGTNGTDAVSISNNYSFNLLYGVNGGLDGIELGGIMNFNTGDVSGFQLSGIANANMEKTSGVMWSGCVNLSVNEMRGVQMADINTALDDLTGVQIGVINYARRLKGVQLGVINVVGEDNGALPVGLINIVKGGHYELELLSGDVIHTNLNYKMGVERFYTIYKLGWSTDNGNDVYSVGLGIGGMVTISGRHKLSIDLSNSQIMYNDDWNWSEDNYLTKLDLNYRLGLGEHVSLVAGPSFNYYVSEVKVDDGFGTLRIPYNVHTSVHQDKQEWWWVGFNAGIAYRF